MIKTKLLAKLQHPQPETFPKIKEGFFSVSTDWKNALTIQPGSEDNTWLVTLEALVLLKMGHFNLSATMLAQQMAISRPTLFRKVKLLTGLTPQQYIAEVRFLAARGWLETRRYSRVKTVAISAGFRDVEHFSRQFRKRFGKRPSDYLE